jgi:hypothetical protein
MIFVSKSFLNAERAFCLPVIGLPDDKDDAVDTSGGFDTLPVPSSLRIIPFHLCHLGFVSLYF